MLPHEAAPGVSRRAVMTEPPRGRAGCPHRGMLPVSWAGWGTGAEERDLIDVGWFSVWVKFVTQWATAATYCWMLVAPALFPDRQFA